ncbi:hypothetical protein FOCC_FOCC007602 [Frankliniella occidentalis]|nr:hypothetical protein FOCC_FOCC007602 [Frankliniella occidentalis]
MLRPIVVCVCQFVRVSSFVVPYCCSEMAPAIDIIESCCDAKTALLSDIDELPCIHLGDFTLTFELGEMNDHCREVALKELRETSENDKDIVVPMDNDAWLVRFLRPCKYYPESAYELIKRYYSFKEKHSSVYRDLLPSKERNIFEANMLTWNHKKTTLDEVYKGCVLFLEAAMLEPETQVCGAVVIFDMDGLSMQQVWQFTPPFAKRIVDWLQDSVPLRVKNIHIINQPYIFNMVFALFKPFLREKLRSRCLPDVYGGSVALPRISGLQWYELLLKCDKEYEAINSFGLKKSLEDVPDKKGKKK